MLTMLGVAVFAAALAYMILNRYHASHGEPVADPMPLFWAGCLAAVLLAAAGTYF